MPIKPVNDPDAARGIAESAFGSMTTPGGGAKAAGLGGGESQIGSVEVYNLPIKDLTMPVKDHASDGLDGAVRTGWRYIQVRPDEDVGEIVEVDEAAGEPTLASFAEGRMAGRMNDAANAAERELASDPSEYEPRILRLPEIQMEALWMHAPDPKVKDRFYGLPNSQKHLIDKDFMDTARTRASEYLKKISGADRSNSVPLDLDSLQKNKVVE